MDGRNKDWWLGYFKGTLEGITMSSNLDNVMGSAKAALEEFSKWELRKRDRNSTHEKSGGNS